ncbi:MAG: thermonuclease family protein [Actinomycetota bacterium]|nr:thermonuclease family protein [Actinomycetota bacterium]
MRLVTTPDGAPRSRAWLGWVVAAMVGLGAIAANSDDEPTRDAATSEAAPDRDSDIGVDRNADDGAAPAVDTEEREARAPKTYRVRSVTDGDTVLLGNGDSVRLVGVDAPEKGECGSERASELLSRLTLGEQVRLTAPVDDRDRYGRLLRYVDVGDTDAGIRLIGSGLAIARYDSRDGYDHHPRQRRYVTTDRSTPNATCAPAPVPLAEVPSSSCASGYSPCIPAYPPDLDCADTGPVTVSGSDPHGLDADGDGVACGHD